MKVEHVDGIHLEILPRTLNLVVQEARCHAVHSADEFLARDNAGIDVLLQKVSSWIGRYCAVVGEIASLSADEQFVALNASRLYGLRKRRADTTL